MKKNNCTDCIYCFKAVRDHYCKIYKQRINPNFATCDKFVTLILIKAEGVQ